jgi:uncharacterized protein YcfJ
MGIQPNNKQQIAGHAAAGVVGGLVGLLAGGGKLEKALVSGVVGVFAHLIMDRPITAYITSHPQEFPRFLAQ